MPRHGDQPRNGRPFSPRAGADSGEPRRPRGPGAALGRGCRHRRGSGRRSPRDRGRDRGGDRRRLYAGVRGAGGPGRETGNGKRVVVCNLATSLVVEDAAREFGADVVRTPVGEVHVARAILRLSAVIGGEGNGGVMYPALHAGRDAPVAAALLLALLARDGKRVSELVSAAPRYVIVKAKAERGTRNAERSLEGVYAALRNRFPEASVDTQDGLRLAWRDRWLHVRPSNTEPIIRLIAEAPTGAAARDLVDEARRLSAASAS